MRPVTLDRIAPLSTPETANTARMKNVFLRASVAAAFALANTFASQLQAQAVTVPPRPATARAGVTSAEDTLTQKFEVAGIPVILRTVTANDVVAANLYLLGGVRQLTTQNEGIETILLEASEQGTRKYPKNDLRAKMARLGSVIAVGPGVDWTSIGLRSTTGGFDSTWSILADRLMSPRLDTADVELVRDQFLTGIKQRRDSPDALLDFVADSVAFAGHAYSLDPVGDEQSITRMTIADLRKYQAEQIVTSRMLLVVVGNVSRARVERLVTATLGKLPKGTYAWKLPELLPTQPSTAAIVKRALPTNYIQGYFRGPRADAKDYASLRLACAVLSGRLFTEIRSRRNLTYSVNAPFVERALSMGGLYVTTTSPDEVLDIMNAEMKSLKDGTIQEDGLERLVQQFIVTYFLDNETNGDQANLLARAELYQGDYRRASHFVEDLRKVTPEDIQRAARTYMKDVRWAYVGDPSKVTTAKMLKF